MLQLDKLMALNSSIGQPASQPLHLAEVGHELVGTKDAKELRQGWVKISKQERLGIGLHPECNAGKPAARSNC